MTSQKKFETTDEIIRTLTELDLHCAANDNYAELVILGGAGILLNLALQDIEFRPTNDIDVETIVAKNMDLFLEGLRKANIHIVGGVMEVPPIEDLKNKDNLLKLEGQGFTNISVFVPSLEILACCKIFSKRQKDLNDLQNTDILVKCNKDELIKLIDEYRPYTLNISDPDINIHRLDNIFLEKGIE